MAVEPENKAARQLKANALRAMAQTTRSLQMRNLMLSYAYHLEGKIDWMHPPKISFVGDITEENVLSTPPGVFLKLLETKIDPEKSVNVEKIVKVTFTDIEKSWYLHVRRGVAEFNENAPGKFDVALMIPLRVWAQIALGKTTVDEAVASKKASFKGSREALTAVFNSFD